jgi:hypothetical protein
MVRNIKMGRVSLPMDVKSSDAVPAFEEMLTKGPMAVVLVYADWCGHCDNYKKNVWSPLKSVKNRTVNMATLREDVIQNTSLKNAKIDGYPSVLVVGKDKKPAVFNSNSGVTNAMPESNDVSTMKSLITSSVPKEVSAQTSNSALTSNSTAVSLNSEYPTLNVSEDTTNSESMNSMNSMNSTSTTSTNSSSLNSENTLNFPKSVTPTALNTEPPSINEDEITLDETTSDETTSVPRSVTPRTSSMPTSTPRTATANSQGSTPILRGGRLFRKLSMKHRKSNKNTRKNKKTSKRKN